MNNASFFMFLEAVLYICVLFLPVTIKKYLHSEIVAVLFSIMKSF